VLVFPVVSDSVRYTLQLTHLQYTTVDYILREIAERP